jgi:hypothetical protein
MRSVCAAIVIGWCSVGAAAGDDAHALLRRGIALYREASFAASVVALEQARARGELEPAERVECAFYLAGDYVAMGSQAAARRELHAVIDAQPGYEPPPYTPPKVTALLVEVREEVERAPRLRALPPRQKHEAAGRRVDLWFEPSRTGGAAYGAAWWRWTGEREFREAPLAHAGENLVAHVAVEQGGTLEYWAEIRTPTGLALAGTRERPLTLPVVARPPSPAVAVASPPARPRTPIVRSWWLWTAVGAVAAAGLGVGLYFALRPQPTSTADAVLDFQVR